MDIKPKLRQEAHTEVYSALVNSVKRVLENQDHFPYQNCLKCLNFDEKPNEICRLYDMRPPAKVIVYGCDKFEDGSDIPF